MKKQCDGQMSLTDWLDAINNGNVTIATAPVAFLNPIPESKVVPSGKIEDFGKKIGGARKDTWMKRGGMNLSDLSGMNRVEQKAFTTKDNVWPRPDYEKMVASGTSRAVAYYINRLRTSLPKAPTSYSVDNYHDYVEFVSLVRDSVKGMKKWEEVIAFCDKYLFDEYFEVTSPRRYRHTEKGLGLVTTSFVNLVLPYTLRSESFFENEAKRKKFAFTEDQKILAKYKIFQVLSAKSGEDYGRKKIALTTSTSVYYMYNAADDSMMVEASYKLKTFAVADGVKILGINFESRKDAEDFVLSIHQKKEGTNYAANRKKSLVPSPIEHIRRIGGEEYRKSDATTDDFLKDFHFYGGEFGNWTNQADRQENLNAAYDAFMDLAKVLKLTPEEVTFGGELSIAFGARGHGRAMAHYEPFRKVINLTKMKGAGSLGHEMIHAIDFIIGERMGFERGDSTAMSKAWRKPDSMKKLMDTIYYNREEIAEALENAEKLYNKAYAELEAAVVKLFPEPKEPKKVLEEMVAYLPKAKAEDRPLYHKQDRMMDEYICEPLEKLFAMYKTVHGNEIRYGDKREVVMLYNSLFSRYKGVMVCKEHKQYRETHTAFYDDAIAIDEVHSKDGGYWSSAEELLARAGACYLKDKLAELGIRNDYLCGHADGAQSISKDGKPIYAYPRGEERKRINEAFDEFFEDLRRNCWFLPRTAEKQLPAIVTKSA